MGIEIERKFVVDHKYLPLGILERPYQVIQQSYLSTKPAVRIRLVTDFPEGTKKAYITVKGPGLLTRSEFEYQIPFDDAVSMLSLCPTALHKKRYTIGEFTLDEFLGYYSGLWLAEIELSHEEATFEKPRWACEEVTKYEEYSNSFLVQKGPWPHPAAWARLYINGFPDNEFVTDFLPVETDMFHSAKVIVDGTAFDREPGLLALYDFNRNPVAYRKISQNYPFSKSNFLPFLDKKVAISLKYDIYMKSVYVEGLEER
jgi:adenylate cyclase